MQKTGFYNCCGFRVVTHWPGEGGISPYATEEQVKAQSELWVEEVNTYLKRSHFSLNAITILNQKQEEQEFARLLPKYGFVKVSIERNPNTAQLLHTYIRRADVYKNDETIPKVEDHNV